MQSSEEAKKAEAVVQKKLMYHRLLPSLEALEVTEEARQVYLEKCAGTDLSLAALRGDQELVGSAFGFRC